MPGFMPNNDKLFIEVRNAVVQVLNVDVDDVTANASAHDDLGADSLDFVELLMKFEELYDIEIDADEAEELRTIGDIVAYLHQRRVKTRR
jgi:acyl carrier protein